MAISETAYLGRDNTIDLQLLANGVPLSVDMMQAITRMVLTFLGQTIDSESNPSVFDWTTRAAEGAVVIALGGLAITAGTDLSADLVVYDAEHLNGLKWSSFTLKVEQG